MSGQCRLRLSPVPAEQVPPDLLPQISPFQCKSCVKVRGCQSRHSKTQKTSVSDSGKEIPEAAELVPSWAFLGFPGLSWTATIARDQKSSKSVIERGNAGLHF